MGFEEIYHYKDSLSSDGKFVIQSVFNGEELLKLMVVMQYDERNRKIKETRKGYGDDTQIITYFYNDNDSLIEERYLSAGIENVFYPNKKKTNSLCFQENELNYFSPNVDNLRMKINELLNINLSILKSDSCENLIYEYCTSKNEINVAIVKNKIYNHKKVICTIKKDLK